MTVTIAEILHLAADEYLAKDFKESKTYRHKEQYSCDAVQYACDDYMLFRNIRQGLINMGCPTGSIEVFSDLEGEYGRVTEESQAARYMWLKFAAMIAEEQGV